MAPSTDPVPLSAYPSFTPVAGRPPAMPTAWSAVALLHPFSPPLSSEPRPARPFFQLCVANIHYRAGAFLEIQLAGCDYGTWWYSVTPGQTRVSTDEGRTWTVVDMGWTLPTDWFGARRDQATCAGRSSLNWMTDHPVDWWKVPVPIPGSPPAATWMWFDPSTGAPVRTMFGQGPPTPVRGDPTQLAFFQMYSFTYFPVFRTSSPAERPTTWARPTFPGFRTGNPDGYQNFVWDANFGMTAFMTPVNEEFNPLPTRVLYVWKSDARYRVYTDRAQHTRMLYTYNEDNPQGVAEQVALLTGRSAIEPPPPDSDEGFLINYYAQPGRPPSCVGGSAFPFPQEPPNWISIPAVEGTIRATIQGNPVVGPGRVVTVFSVLFPPAPPNYPEATYLWTWYSPQDETGLRSRPITFMQSQSGVGVGTSLALADYHYYREFTQPIDPANFLVPSACSVQTRKHGLRRCLP